MASGADDILQHAVVHDSLDSALAGCPLALGTSARLRSLPMPMFDARRAAREALQESGKRRCRPCLMTTATTILALLPVLTDPTTGKTGQNLKYDLEVLARHGVEIAGIDGDTLLADYLLNPDRRSHKLDDLALVYLNHKMIPFSDMVPKGGTFDQVPLEEAGPYAAEDADITLRLHQVLGERYLGLLVNQQSADFARDALLRQA